MPSGTRKSACTPTPDAGAATLAGTRLPAVQAAAGMARLTAIARAMKAAGMRGGLDYLRAVAYVGLILGTLPAGPPAAGDPPAPTAPPTPTLGAPGDPGRRRLWPRRLSAALGPAGGVRGSALRRLWLPAALGSAGSGPSWPWLRRSPARAAQATPTPPAAMTGRRRPPRPPAGRAGAARPGPVGRRPARRSRGDYSDCGYGDDGYGDDEDEDDGPFAADPPSAWPPIPGTAAQIPPFLGQPPPRPPAPASHSRPLAIRHPGPPASRPTLADHHRARRPASAAGRRACWSW